jgi:hypothetical protein
VSQVAGLISATDFLESVRDGEINRRLTSFFFLDEAWSCLHRYVPPKNTGVLNDI